MKLKMFAAASLAALGLTSFPAAAAHLPSFSFTEEPFTFDATAYGGGTFSATYIDFSYEAEVDQLADSSFDETGLGFFGTFRESLGGSPVLGTGLGSAYQLYGTFEGAGTIALNGAGGIDGTFDTFTFNLYIDPGMDTTSSTFTVGGADESKFATGTTGDDVLILTGTILVGGTGGSGGFHVFPGLVAGDFDVLMSVASFDPSIWGGLAFSGDSVLADLNGVNTRIEGVALPGTAATDIRIIGSGNFSAQHTIPVPGVLGLLGAGLLGLGWVNGRSRKNA